jgi:hypothetical protein
MFESDKLMFQIYKESEYNQRYKVVYFTELHDYNREVEINRALAGEPFYDGFIRNFKKDQAKKIIEEAVRRLNDGEQLSPEDIEKALVDYIPRPTEIS